MDAGALAHSSYNNYAASNPNASIGLPTAGFAARGKAMQGKRLSLVPSSISTANHDNVQPSGLNTPRTSRSHLLAGLRTAPKSTNSNNGIPPPSAPPTQLHHKTGLDGSRYAEQDRKVSRAVPQTATTSSFPQMSQHNPYAMNNRNRQMYPLSEQSNSRQMYSLPEQVLAPPAIPAVPEYDEQMDPNLYNDLLATNLYLAQQQQRLQQQLLSVTAAAQQFQGMNIGQQQQQQQQQLAQQQQLQQLHQLQQQISGQNTQYQQMQNMQTVITPVPGAQSGVYSVFNPVTGQQSYYVDPNAAQQQQPAPAPVTAREERKPSPPQANAPQFRAQITPPADTTATNIASYFNRSGSPPKSSSPADEVPSLPPPSANAFRRGHKKASSLASCVNANSTANMEGPRTGFPRVMGLPPTPMTGTFGPGGARPGEHPNRQPRGPPSMEDLITKPNATFEGSKNFAGRRRRSAVSSLVRAGMERRTGRTTSSNGSAGSMTPVSETEAVFSNGSDDDTNSTGSETFVARPNLRAAIGSERKASLERSRERASLASSLTLKNGSSDDSSAIGKFVEADMEPERRKTPLLVLTSAAEKRKSSMF